MDEIFIDRTVLNEIRIDDGEVLRYESKADEDYHYKYRVYGDRGVGGYKLLEETNSMGKALSYTSKMDYDKILIIRHNVELNMDEPIVYAPIDVRKGKSKIRK